MKEARIPRSWLMLALGTGGQTASTTVLYGLPYLLPAFREELGLSLVGAGILVSCPIVGILLGLIGWGVVADRYGERLALSAGLLGAAAAMAAAAAAPGVRSLGALLVLAGAAGSSVCVPQFVVTGFSLLFLTEVRGWSAATAGTVLAVADLAGAGVRLLVGWWSDTLGSRVRPMRLLALVTAVDLALLTAGAAWHSPLATVAPLLAAGLTASTNGLHNTAVAEYAGPDWAGRALGVHGMGQHAAVVLVPPLAGALIAGRGYPPLFAAAALFTLPAMALLPTADRTAMWAAPTAARAGT
ncbi:MFS transporter [Streptomyces sp. H34-S4]|uniref:MFS transporter n=1 Tax=Streptomyces sp. H34-S4 TaxID=2996463 RepID=UPI00226E7C93|nr:MFS transporter [Streptomyces sp. H34-S4]MCY0935359.1 MFS transporter [Streptomyces sp. H34-S4]